MVASSLSRKRKKNLKREKKERNTIGKAIKMKKVTMSRADSVRLSVISSGWDFGRRAGGAANDRNH